MQIFTDKTVQALEPRKAQYVVTEFSDQHNVGRFQIIVYPSGVKSFQIQYYHDKKRRRMEIGKYGVWTLAKARKRFFELSALVAEGEDPKASITAAKEQKALEQREAERAASMSELLADFYIYIEGAMKPRTVKRIKLDLNCDLVPWLNKNPGIRPQEFIDKGLVRDAIYEVWNRGAKEKARLVRADLMSMFKFAIDYDNSPENYKEPDKYGVKYNPCRDIVINSPKVAGQRWLDENELRQVWYAEDLPIMAKLFFRLNIALAGQRVQELQDSNVADFDIDEKIFTIPAERVKVVRKGDHIVPLSSLAIDVLRELKPYRNEKGLLFPHRDNPERSAPYTTNRMAYLRWCDRNGFKRFAPRDIRRTCKTLMGKAGIPQEDKDRLQQHHKSDVSSVNYDRYDYLSEKRQAIEKWTEYLLGVIKR